MEELTDQEILAGCLSGNIQMQEAFVKRFSNDVYRAVQYAFQKYIRRYSQPEDFEDLHNTVFLKIFENRWKKLRQYNGSCKLSTWIKLIAARTVIDHLRKKKKDPPYKKIKSLEEIIAYIQDISANTLSVIEEEEEEEKYRLIETAMRRMTPRYRLFFKLLFYKGLSLNEIMDIMKISMENAYSLKHRALKQLKSLIKEEIKCKEKL
ncbi:MAG: RNA polymerase sigma factor [bacterium]